MHPNTLRGLKRYGKETPTKDIAKDLEDNGIEEPGALAAWIRKRGIGEAAFKRHQEQARKGKKD